jgi:hypothetical protein
LPRIRSLKPEILHDQRTAGLTDAAWRLFVSMILIADDYGNQHADARLLRAEVFWGAPAPPEDVRPLLDELERVKLVRFYRVRGQSYVHLAGWAKNQKIYKPGRHVVPPVEEGEDQESSPKEVKHTRRATDSGILRESDRADWDRERDRERDREEDSPGGPGLVVASLFEQTLRAFKAEWEHRYHAEYVPSVADKSSLGRLLRDLPTNIVAQLPACFANYLADEDPFIAGARRHDLTWFCGKGQGWNKYRVSAPVRSGREATTLAAGEQWLEISEGRRPHGRH